MPTLVYFGLQGRAQATRYALAAANVEFEDKKLTFEEWGPLKAAGTYGEGNSLPVFVDDDGTMYNQSKAILKMVCAKNGFVPADAAGLYEQEWYFDSLEDAGKVGDFAKAIFAKSEDEENIKKVAGGVVAMIEKLDARIGDKAFITGDSPSAADFQLLAGYTSLIANKNLHNPALSEITSAAADKATNYKRVIENVMALGGVQAAVDGLSASFI